MFEEPRRVTSRRLQLATESIHVALKNFRGIAKRLHT
jgi:hypothetical protein